MQDKIFSRAVCGSWGNPIPRPKSLPGSLWVSRPVSPYQKSVMPFNTSFYCAHHRLERPDRSHPCGKADMCGKAGSMSLYASVSYALYAIPLFYQKPTHQLPYLCCLSGACALIFDKINLLTIPHLYLPIVFAMLAA